MGIIAALVVILLVLFIWSRGSRKTIAKTIILSEDGAHRAQQIVKATPAVANKAKDHAQNASRAAVSTSVAVGKIAASKGSSVAGIAQKKGLEFADESKHYVKGFIHDVKHERVRMLSERKKAAREEKTRSAS